MIVVESGPPADVRTLPLSSVSGPWDGNTQVYFGPNRNYDSNQSLTPGTTYYVAVRATNASGQATNQNGNSLLSNIVQVTTPLTVPDAPTGLNVLTPTPNQITATWNSVSGASNYRAYRSLSSSGPWAVVKLRKLTPAAPISGRNM